MAAKQKTYVRTQVIAGAETVVEVIGPVPDIAARYHPDFVKTLIDVTALDPQPAEWWTYDGSVFSAPVPVEVPAA